MYVYGVVRADDSLWLPGEGVAGRSVTRVTELSLTAVVSEFDEDAMRPTRRNVMAHSKVLQELVLQTTLLPIRFGVVMPSADAVRHELLVAHADALRAELDGLDGCVQLDVTVTCRQDAQLRRVVTEDPQLRAVLARLDAAGVDERIAFGERVARAVEDERARMADLTIDALRGTVVDAVVKEPRHDDVLAGVAFLVERHRIGAFESALEVLNVGLGEARQVRCVGPLPPYHFVDLGLAVGEAGAWA